jgi:hypothetical protein
MKKEAIYNADLHFEHVFWTKELDFWEDELKSFNNRIEELVMRWTDPSVLAQIEKFQNQFLIQENAMNSVRNQIDMHETNMAEHYKINEDVLNKGLVKKHLMIRDQMETQRSIYQNLKKEFFKFLTKYM